MKVTILGCGNAFSTKNYNQCFLLEEHGRRMLIDYGFQAPAALAAAGVSISSIDDVYISHLHADHIGGLEQMAFLRYDWKDRATQWNTRFPDSPKAPRLIANEGIIRDLWHKSLRGGLESMEGFDADLNTFFEVMPLAGNQTFVWQGWSCRLIQQIHIMTGTMVSSTFGLFMISGDHALYFTTDSQHCSPKQVEVFYKQASVIFQDCECLGVNTATQTMDFSSGVHANFGQLAGYHGSNSTILSPEIRGKMWLSHYQDFVSDGKDYKGNTCDWNAVAKDSYMQGFVKVGQVFEF